MLEILALGKELLICIKKQIHLLSQHTPASVCFPGLPLAHIQGAQIRSFTTNLRNKDAFLKHYKTSSWILQDKDTSPLYPSCHFQLRCHLGNLPQPPYRPPLPGLNFSLSAPIFIVKAKRLIFARIFLH